MRVQVGEKSIKCELAQDHQKGLQGHAPLNDDEGMIFAWPMEGSRTFHMAEVTFPIDIAFIDQNGRVTEVVHYAQPGTRARWTATAKWVLETKGGRLNGINKGAILPVQEDDGRPANVQPPPAVPVAGTRVVGRRRAEEHKVEDPPAFLWQMVSGIVRLIEQKKIAIPWKPAAARPDEEEALLDGGTLRGWFRATGAPEPVAADVTSAALRSPELIAGAFTALGTGSAEVTPYGVMLRRPRAASPTISAVPKDAGHRYGPPRKRLRVVPRLPTLDLPAPASASEASAELEALVGQYLDDGRFHFALFPPDAPQDVSRVRFGTNEEAALKLQHFEARKGIKLELWPISRYVETYCPGAAGVSGDQRRAVANQKTSALPRWAGTDPTVERLTKRREKLAAKRAELREALSGSLSSVDGTTPSTRLPPRVAGLRQGLDVSRARFPARAAQDLVENLIAGFDVPARVSYQAGTTRRAAGAGPHGVTDGEIDVWIHLKPPVGPVTKLRVPVQVRAGEMLAPTTVVIDPTPAGDGKRAVLAQGTFDDILRRTTVIGGLAGHGRSVVRRSIFAAAEAPETEPEPFDRDVWLVRSLAAAMNTLRGYGTSLLRKTASDADDLVRQFMSLRMNPNTRPRVNQMIEQWLAEGDNIVEKLNDDAARGLIRSWITNLQSSEPDEFQKLVDNWNYHRRNKAAPPGSLEDAPAGATPGATPAATDAQTEPDFDIDVDDSPYAALSEDDANEKTGPMRGAPPPTGAPAAKTPGRLRRMWDRLRGLGPKPEAPAAAPAAPSTSYRPLSESDTASPASRAREPAANHPAPGSRFYTTNQILSVNGGWVPQGADLTFLGPEGKDLKFQREDGSTVILDQHRYDYATKNKQLEAYEEVGDDEFEARDVPPEPAPLPPEAYAGIPSMPDYDPEVYKPQSARPKAPAAPAEPLWADDDDFFEEPESANTAPPPLGDRDWGAEIDPMERSWADQLQPTPPIARKPVVPKWEERYTSGPYADPAERPATHTQSGVPILRTEDGRIIPRPELEPGYRVPKDRAKTEPGARPVQAPQPQGSPAPKAKRPRKKKTEAPAGAAAPERKSPARKAPPRRMKRSEGDGRPWSTMMPLGRA